MGSAKQESLVVSVDGVVQASRDLGRPATSHMYQSWCSCWPPHPGKFQGDTSFPWSCLEAQVGPRFPEQLRALKQSQAEPETASEMPLSSGDSPGAGERATQ